MSGVSTPGWRSLIGAALVGSLATTSAMAGVTENDRVAAGILFYTEHCGSVEDKLQLFVKIFGTQAGIKSVQAEMAAGLRQMRLRGMSQDEAYGLRCAGAEYSDAKCGGQKMRTLSAIAIGAALAGSLVSSPAPASPILPPQYLGQWCMLEGYDDDEFTNKMLFEPADETGPARKQCERDGRFLTMTWSGFTFARFGYTPEGKIKCSFTSIRRTGDRFGTTTHTPWGMQIPEVEFSIYCADGYTNQYRAHIGRGAVLHFEAITPLPRLRPR
jgi:hypothetical protein